MELKIWKATIKPYSFLAVNPGIPIHECSPDPRYRRGEVLLVEKELFDAQALEISALKEALEVKMKKTDLEQMMRVKLPPRLKDMEVREFFAGFAMMGLLANPNTERPSDVAKAAVLYADALVEELKELKERDN